jgi:hypothetical protein
LSEAVAVRVRLPDIEAPWGEAMETVGGIMSMAGRGLLTITVLDAEVVLLPAASLAVAVRV